MEARKGKKQGRRRALVLEKIILPSLFMTCSVFCANVYSISPIPYHSMTSSPGTWIAWGKDKALSISWTASIAFRVEGILDFLEGKVFGVGGRPTSYWVDTLAIVWDLEAKYSRRFFDKASQVARA